MYRKSTSTWRYPLGLLAAYGIAWIALAIDPDFRKDWLLENAIVFAAIPVFVLSARRLRFSDLAYTCLFIFFALHAVGAHYTCALVPYADWWRARGGAPLEGRNLYDRVVHFADKKRGRAPFPDRVAIPMGLAGKGVRPLFSGWLERERCRAAAALARALHGDGAAPEFALCARYEWQGTLPVPRLGRRGRDSFWDRLHGE